MNLREIILLLRCYSNCNLIEKSVLERCEKNIFPRKKEMNIIDLADICGIYFGAVAEEII